MRSKRPTAVLVIAIFHFVFGGLGLLCGLPGLVMQAAGVGGAGTAPAAGATQQQKDLQEMQVRVQQRTEKEAPLQTPFVLCNTVLNLVISLLLVVSGFGLVKMQTWGWWGSVVYGVVRILMQIYMFLFYLLYSMPLTGRILEEELKSRPSLQPFAFVYQIITPIAIAGTVLGLIYPIIVLIVMSRPKVRAAFQGGQVADDFDDSDDRPARRRRRDNEDDDVEEDDETHGYDDDPDERFRPAR